MPTALRSLDDRVLRSRRGSEPPAEDRSHDEGTTRVERRPARRPGNGDGLPSFLAVLWRVCRLVLLALALLLVLAIAFILLPTNDDNVIVRNVLSFGEDVAGPFKDVFTSDDEDRRRISNYGLAAVVYLVLSTVVGKLPTGSRKRD